MSDKLPLTEAEWNATQRPVPLDADATDLRLASEVFLKPCPFCGSKSIVAHGQLNKQTQIYGYHVECGACFASVLYNDFAREEARTKAVERWQTRAPVAAPGAVREQPRES